jgi:hypothetical protein
VAAARVLLAAVGLSCLSTAPAQPPPRLTYWAPGYPEFMLYGTIIDDYGAAIFGGEVVLSDCAENRPISHLQSLGGYNFLFFRQPEACYEISVTIPGYSTVTQRVNTTPTNPLSRAVEIAPIRMESLGAFLVPKIIQGQSNPENSRSLTAHFSVRIGGHDFIVTTHSAQDEPVAFSIWRVYSKGLQLVNRIDDQQYDTFVPLNVNRKTYLLMETCDLHNECDWGLSRLEPTGRMTRLKIPDLSAPEILGPGEELFGFGLDLVKARDVLTRLDFVAYVCRPKAMPCRLGDQWQGSEGWDDDGPQMIQGRYSIVGNSLHVVEVRRKRYDGGGFPEHGPGIVR